LPDGKRYIEYLYSFQCAGDNFLSLTKADARISRSDGEVIHTESVSVKDGLAIITSTDNDTKTEKKIDLPKKSVLDICVFYLVALLPQESGKKYRIDSFISVSDFKTGIPHIITCLGPDDTTSSPNDRWIKYVDAENEKDPGIQYWVDKNGLLQRVKLNKTNQLDLKK
jgi:hypothetical protein